MTLVSFKSAARYFEKNRINNKRYMFRLWETAAVLCNMAHAISRGRNPSSTIPGVNIRDWYYHAQCNTTRGYTDCMGEPCNILDYLYEMANDYCDDPTSLRLRIAIGICTKYFNKVGWPKRPLTNEEKEQRREEWLDRKSGRYEWWDDSGLLVDHNNVIARAL